VRGGENSSPPLHLCSQSFSGNLKSVCPSFPSFWRRLHPVDSAPYVLTCRNFRLILPGSSVPALGLITLITELQPL
jgi:hypothetical protein